MTNYTEAQECLYRLLCSMMNIPTRIIDQNNTTTKTAILAAPKTLSLEAKGVASENPANG